ncbi:hypothetical protein SERLA73DRAFT_178940 [Serpula lacrymans var. lacrymans S7.3]|uniref:Aminotransferase class V domain-containing protein n=2 Tax=Serpula lacrymans var. lacrymans TaxID=341189 RepID=F8PTA4_SERL3|nr:putative aminotransferase [Serpula lacrymans var. lacrymans S7.9]EGO00934.1 hypothetical protein SERLA73DRAFT_178940 [Serpula lacrymans var. lacrymans S7.3]EGO26554.1 putative aminotransferase [Serpula lacrymans var. lacrymans S7.9]
MSSESSSPAFGHAMRSYFGFDSDYINLNHGAFGAVPKPVVEAAHALTNRVESNPDYFMRLEYELLLDEGRARLAQLVGADVDECVLVPNVSNGINTVLRNFEWAEGDILVSASTTFDSIARAVENITGARPQVPHPGVSKFILDFPQSHATILASFREHLRAVKSQAPNNTIVALIDTIVSQPAILMPWKQMVKICKEEGVWSVIDGAHSLGQELNIGLSEADPDFWVGSCSKWMYTKRGCTLLYVPKRNQHIIKTTLPTAHSVLAASEDKPPTAFVMEFIYFGTVEAIPFLSIKAALDFRDSIGGEETINAYCHSLAKAGGRRLAEVMGTSMMVTDNEDELIANMVNVELPFPATIASTKAVFRVFQNRLLQDHKMYAGHFFHNGKWWTRACAQIYNEIGDFEKLGYALVAICNEIKEAEAR